MTRTNMREGTIYLALYDLLLNRIWILTKENDHAGMMVFFLKF